ncbi:MAG: redoxin domain-containing protein [Sphingobacteriales bacterium]|nr:redoxin domain-containing protein [Sphingobacteriales bacterium]
MEKRNEQLVKVNNSFLYKKIFTIDKNEISLIDTVKKKATILELYFVKCPPCKMKLAVLKELYNKLHSEEFQIFFICDGSLTSYNDFISNAKENNGDGFSFFYDSKNNICDSIIHVNGYPQEILLNRTVIHSTHYGFDEYSKTPYIEDEISKIKNILNEN